jgi:hypothetical protein
MMAWLTAPWTSALEVATIGRRNSKPGRPALPKDLHALIRWMALENRIWGQERIANELLLKLGLQVSPRTVRKYMPDH